MSMQSVIPVPAAQQQQYMPVPTNTIPGFIVVGGMPTSREDPEFGTHKTMKTHVPNIIQVRYKAEFHKYCCYSVNQLRDRQYFWVLENSIERNLPMGCYCIPPNCCCPGSDNTAKWYYDRGVWDKQTFCYGIGCLKGEPYVTNGKRKYVCLCMDCCDCYNTWAAGQCCNPCCGESVYTVRCEACCCCIPNQSCFLTNCCSLCGLKDGQPLCISPIAPVVTCLALGTSEEVTTAINTSRLEFLRRVHQI